MSDEPHPSSRGATQQSRSARTAKRLIAAAGVIAVLAGVVTAWKLDQDRRRYQAQQLLSKAGLVFAVGPSETTGHSVLTFRANKPELDDAGLASVAEHLTTLTRRYDFYFTDGSTIESIDLRGTSVTEGGIAPLQERLPATKITL